MMKRKKKMPEYVKFKSMREKGEKMDKKTVEAGESWEAINETLKLELPKLYSLSHKLISAATDRLIECQKDWYQTWTRKLESIIEGHSATGDLEADLVSIEKE